MPSTTAAPALIRRRSLLGALPSWWHLLSLDAPTVAALWSWSLARSLGARLPVTAPLLLATGTWLLYVADRLLDVRLLDARSPAAHLRERHHFSYRHRRSFLTATIPITALLLWLIAFRMSPAARRDDTALFALTLAYFAAVHWPRGAGRRIFLPKEMAVGILFALAAAVPAWARIPHVPFSTALLGTATALFAVLCWLNCAAIEKWEQDKWEQGKWENPALLRQQSSHPTTQWLQRRLTVVSIALATTGLIAAALCIPREADAAAALFLALSLAAVLLAVLDRRHTHLPALPLRIAADAALLTPLLVLPILR
ncbi:hypothetical protein [Silvibacterium sp.]|uniref:hypothetical protein n=1 Tax=Silvibacterium sp. TaxID=1964179 RepID=UPI0039E5B9E3